MKAVIVIDSFKGCLSSREAGDAVEKGILRAIPEAETVKIPVADGGEGTVEALVDALGGVFEEVEVHGPLLEPVLAKYGIADVDNKKCAIIESAAAIGLPLVPDNLRNPMKTSSFGLGEPAQESPWRRARACRSAEGGHQGAHSRIAQQQRGVL